MKKLLFVLLLSTSFSVFSQQTYTIEWGFGSNTTQPTTSNQYTNLSIEVGDTVVWSWMDDGGAHNVDSTASSTEDFNSGSPTSTVGNTFSHIFTQVGTNPYACQPHAPNMNGTISVSASTANTTEFTNSISNFSVYPNPGTHEININIPSLNKESLTIEVFDVLGKKIHSKSLNEINTKINISKWNSGLYLIRLTSNQSIKSTKRFVKL